MQCRAAPYNHATFTCNEVSLKIYLFAFRFCPAFNFAHRPSSTLLERVVFQQRYVHGRDVEPLGANRICHAQTIFMHGRFHWMLLHCRMPIHSTHTHTQVLGLKWNRLYVERKWTALSRWTSWTKNERNIFTYKLWAVCCFDGIMLAGCCHKRYKFQIKTFSEWACIWPIFFLLICDG